MVLSSLHTDWSSEPIHQTNMIDASSPAHANNLTTSPEDRRLPAPSGRLTAGSATEVAVAVLPPTLLTAEGTVGVDVAVNDLVVLPPVALVA